MKEEAREGWEGEKKGGRVGVLERRGRGGARGWKKAGRGGGEGEKGKVKMIVLEKKGGGEGKKGKENG